MHFSNTFYHPSQLQIPESSVDVNSKIILDYNYGAISVRHGNVGFVVDFLRENNFFTQVRLNGNNFLNNISPLLEFQEQILALSLTYCPLLADDTFYSALSKFENLLSLNIGGAVRTGANFNNLLNDLSKLSIFYANSCSLNTNEIDDILNVFASTLENRFSQIGQLYLQNNSPPSENSTSAIDTLINAGWTIIHD